MKTLEPYDHDCDKCVWVGWFSYHPDKDPANIYLCQNKTVVIRFSSEPSDYWSATAGEMIKGKILLKE